MKPTTLEEERQARVDAWEQQHGRKLEELDMDEWISAAQSIFCLTRSEAEEYYIYLVIKTDQPCPF